MHLASRILCCFVLLSGSLARAAEDFLPGVKRVVFLGDSITHAGQYIDSFEAFLFTQFPDRQFEVIDCGLSSETVSGLSEEGHAGGKFPRPDLHERLDRVLAKTKPDLVFACYGMNDGIYKPYDDAWAKKFQDGIRRLRDKAAAAGAQIIHLTPPVFDSVPIAARVAPAGQESASAPFEGYDEVLARYAAWLLDRRAEGWRVIDVHGPMKAELARQREKDATFAFAKDGVHPNAAGQEVIATALLAGLDPARAEKFRQWRAGEWAQSSSGKVFFGAIHKRGRLLCEAWLSEIGHLRPGVPAGLPLTEAQARAAEIGRKLSVER